MYEEHVSASYPYKENFVEVFGSKIHYTDIGQGETMLFLHGMPASSYVWRNIIPLMPTSIRCIAPDLIGMGKSEKPDIEYSVFDHIRYIEEFIKLLNLKNIILVLHGWGSVIGFDYAMRHSENIKAIAFYEAHVQPVTDWHMLSLPVQQLATLLTSEYAKKAVVERNYLINKILPRTILRKLSAEEFQHYSAPFTKENDRKVLWQYIQDLPLGKDGPKNVMELIERYSKALQESKLPKLMLYGVPGFMTPIATVMWARDNLKDIVFGDLHESLHYAQETTPKLFGQILKDWYLNLKTTAVT